MAEKVEGEAVSIPAGDGSVLSGRWFEPDGTMEGAVLIAPGLGIRSGYYRSFATWLESRGFAVLTFDYRGYGESAHGHLRNVDADAVRWAEDAASALEYLHGRADGVPVTWIGHSFGAQALAFADPARVDRFVAIAAGTGYWRFNPPWARWRAPVLWTMLAPAAVAVAGYYPGRRLGIFDDLPGGVMRQWARWCMRPDYLFSEFPEMRERFAAVTVPMLSVSFTDDAIMSRESITDLNSWYSGTKQSRLRLSPAQVDAEKVGHLGFFREVAPPIWDELLLAHLGSRAASA